MALPDGLQFLKLGWWVVHVMAFLLAYQFGYARGRGDEKRDARQREVAKGK